MILRIKDIPDFERPRERLLSTGASNLSNEELLAIILRCGTKQKSAKELSLDLLKELKTLPDLKKLTIHKIMSINGIGISKTDLPQVFNKSFTGNNGRIINSSTGMGLYIAKKMCLKLGHEITIESKVGEYTKVNIIFYNNDYFAVLK